ncbi:hypothetical protein [Bradyrhizobium sp. RDM4]|uniref:hypothetical protein n=1 Tax=Bradyrhizobium sp. RDM4 TaxID=3378765 RepID=UPI0038FCEDB1
MASIKKEINAAKLAKAGIARKSWSKLEFCARNGISEGFYDKLQKDGDGPDETVVRDRVLITVDDENKWLRQNKRKAAKAKAEAASIKAASAEA